MALPLVPEMMWRCQLGSADPALSRASSTQGIIPQQKAVHAMAGMETFKDSVSAKTIIETDEGI